MPPRRPLVVRSPDPPPYSGSFVLTGPPRGVLAPRRILPRLIRRLENRRVVVLTGARQTGKTTLVRELLAPRAPVPLLYRSLDDPEERIRIGADPVGSIDRPDRLVVLDEIQKLPVLFDAVKVLADRPTGARFLLLGSSQIRLLGKVTETLAGRAALLDLWPLAVGERVEGGDAPPALLDRIWDDGPGVLAREGIADPPPDRARALRAAAERTLAWGGFPPVSALPDEVERRAWLRDYRRTFLERDLADLGRVADLDQFARAQSWVAARTGKFLSYSDLARDLGVAVNTAKRYVRFLEVSCQVVLLEPFLPRLERRLAKNPKVFWMDAGLARVLAGRSRLDNGPLFESYVASELTKWRSFCDDAPDLLYFRAHGGLEVDLLLASEEVLLAIECKASAHPHPADARSLERFLREEGRGRRRTFGLLVHRGREVSEVASRVWAIPDWLLFGPSA